MGLSRQQGPLGRNPNDVLPRRPRHAADVISPHPRPAHVAARNLSADEAGLLTAAA
jgi:hypothetical protein